MKFLQATAGFIFATAFWLLYLAALYLDRSSQ